MTPMKAERTALAGGAVVLFLALVGAGCSSGADGAGSEVSTAAGETEYESGPSGEATEVKPERERISGDFEISNTTPGGADAVVETIVVSVETAAAGTAWTAVPAVCSTTPAPPIRIETSTRIGYECVPSSAGIGDARRRVVVSATIAGSDEVFRIVSEIP